MKVLDFGLVKELRSVPFGGPQGTTLTRKGDLLGSPRFMSPEQFGGEVDHRTDIWSLGVTLYMLLSDEAPFEASGLTELQEAITSGRSIPLSVRRGGVPPALEEVIARCLQVRPEARWQTARDLARALEPFAVATPSEPGRRRLGGAAVPFELGRYTVVKRIAAGGMGTVYLGRARGAHGFSRPVAIKQLHAHLAEDADTRRRFLAEARVASRIDHPHVVKVLDVVEDDEQVFLVLDYVQGETFQHLLRTSWEHGKFVPLAVVSAVIAQTAEALHSAHEAPSETGAKLEIVHRDVSPHNILVGQQGAAYVTDFGIAKVREQAAETRNAVLGKTGYMAPEQLRGERVTRAADIFALGVTLWEALTNQALFPTLEERLRVENGPHAALAAAPSAFNPEVSRALDALVMQMLARDPAARPKTALEVAQRLRAEVPPAPADVVSAWIASLARESDDRAPGAPGPTASIERPVLVADLPDTVEAPPTPVLAAPVSSPTLPEPPARSARVGLRIAAASAIVICVSVVALQRASQAGAAKPARTTANEAVREETPLAPSSTLGVVSRAETAPEPPPAPSAKPRVSRQPPRPASTGGAAEPFPAQRK